MKKMLIALAATAVLGMGIAVAESRAYNDGYTSGTNHAENSCEYKNNRAQEDCNRGYVDGYNAVNK
ncbi:MAG: hypothetical protein K2H67_03865 [Treponemataceae bacterium]|nr:hypothetical protein [Treponemataceae bacterium]